MQHRDWSLQQAVDYVLKERLRPGDGGIIGLDRSGKVVWVFTTPGMYRATADSSGRFDIRISNE